MLFTYALESLRLDSFHMLSYLIKVGNLILVKGLVSLLVTMSVVET